MMPQLSFPRRSFFATPALLAAETTWITLSAGEAEWLGALCEQIIPADQDPGARDASVVRYIDKQLAGPLKRFRPAYRDGLAEFQRRKPDFLKLSFDEQTAYLTTVEATPFFQMLIDHTMQGFYGDPKHGGNRDRASWKMLKIDRFLDHGPWQGHTHEVG
jgi:gluconate 2-dehydrogenase gamma chain